MIARRTAAFAAAVVLACTAQAPPLTGEQILARAKAVFRAHARPPYVVYSVERRDEIHGAPSLADSYDRRVWCRTADRDALTRRTWRGAAYGPMENITVAFDGYVDPGPPTADVFERAVFAQKPDGESPQPAATALQAIGSSRVVAEYDYRVRRVSRDGGAWHLILVPRRDALRNRIDDLWVSAATYEIERMRVRDHLYVGFADALDEEFDVRFIVRDGLPLIEGIQGATADGQYRTRYSYRVEAMPDRLPEWYFEPKTYGAHRADAPS